MFFRRMIIRPALFMYRYIDIDRTLYKKLNSYSIGSHLSTWSDGSVFVGVFAINITTKLSQDITY